MYVKILLFNMEFDVKNGFVSFLIILVMAILSSCGRYASESKLDAISIRMKKEEVLEKMGGHGIARGSILNKYGQVIEIREYKTRDWLTSSWRDFENTYWLYFCEGILVQWGRAGDWAETEKTVYDINFKTSSG